MQSIQNIKSRMRSVKNIGQITKAMELVAATKMRRAQETALASRPYAIASLKFLSDISKLEDVKIPPLLEKREVKKILFVLVTSDKGLAGSFNSALIRKFEDYIKKNLDSAETLYAAVGQKAAAYLQRKSLPLVKKFTRAGDFAKTEEINPIADFLINGYLQNEWDKVVVFSTHFRSALKQEPLTRQILPVEFENIKQTIKEIVPEIGRFSKLVDEENIPVGKENLTEDYLVEPSPEEVLGKLAAHLVFMQVYHIVLEANASEHSARRLAMKNASDNASGLSDELNLEYNKSRQAGITREILEITSGAEALK